MRLLPRCVSIETLPPVLSERERERERLRERETEKERGRESSRLLLIGRFLTEVSQDYASVSRHDFNCRWDGCLFLNGRRLLVMEMKREGGGGGEEEEEEEEEEVVVVAVETPGILRT